MFRKRRLFVVKGGFISLKALFTMKGGFVYCRMWYVP